MSTHPAEHLRPLSPVIGRWASQGQTVTTGDAPSIPIIGTDVYSWLAGGQFIEHRVNVRMGVDVVEALEVIGGTDGAFVTMRAFDNDGMFTEMRATVDDGTGAISIVGEHTRATLIVSEDGNAMEAHWERSAGGSEWSPWMDMRFTRI